MLIGSASPESARTKGRIQTGAKVLIALILFLFAIQPYRYILNLSFTGIDTIPTIAAAKISAINELPSVFIRELRGGITPYISYYRPLTLLTYTYDFSIWEWNPLGYHLTDLVLHGLAVVSVFWMAMVAFKQRSLIAFLIALIFLMHPVTNEVVPAISRREEPIFMIGLAIALIGAASMPHRKGLLASVVGSMIAVTSVERALIVPAIIMVFLYLIRLENRALSERIRLTFLWSLPSFTIAVGFFILRWSLFRNTGIQFSLKNFVQFPIGFIVSVIYPQQIFPLRWPTDRFSVGLIALGSVILLAVVAYTLLKAQQHNLYFFCGAVILMMGMLLAFAGQFLPWYPYVAAAFFALFVASLAYESVDRLRNVSWLDTGSIVALSVITLVLLLMVIASPVTGEYEGWKIASEQVDNITHELQRLRNELPGDTGMVLINIPSHYRENSSDYRITRSAAMLWPYSLQPWLIDQSMGNPVVILGSSAHTGQIKTPIVEKVTDSTVEIFFGGPENLYYPTEFPWPPSEMEGHHFNTYIYDGEQLNLIPRLSQN